MDGASEIKIEWGKDAQRRAAAGICARRWNPTTLNPNANLQTQTWGSEEGTEVPALHEHMYLQTLARRKVMARRMVRARGWGGLG